MSKIINKKMPLRLAVVWSIFGGLLCCNILSMIMAKISAGYFFAVQSPKEYVTLLLLVGVWGGSYVARLLLWLLAGRYFQLSFLYPMLEIDIFLAYGIGIYFWHEPFSLNQLGGLSLIFIGIMLILSSSNRYETATVDFEQKVGLK